MEGVREWSESEYIHFVRERPRTGRARLVGEALFTRE